LRARLPRDPARRRRLVALAVACLVALVTGAEAGGRAGEDDAAPSPEPVSAAAERAEALSLRQQVGQLIVVSFDGTEPPAYVRRALEAGQAAGAILFAENVASEAQLRGLTGSLQDAAGGSALVAVDQEGGSIRIVPFAAPEPAASAVSRPQQAERLARQAGSDLAEVGVNVNLAPVADVAVDEGSVMFGRAYPGGGERVAELVGAAVGGTAEGGVAATAKHFPGLGAATVNTDDAAVTIRSSAAQLEASALAPFRAAIAADVPLVMVSHALYPALDRARIASQSPVVLQDLLRGELGFEGVIVTDSMEAEAVLRRSPTPAAAVRSVAAGADLLLTTLSASYAPVLDRLVAAAERSPELRARIDESAGRVLALKERLGLALPPPQSGG
jgi:beta-N-acetylhexosaminidase